MKMIKFLITLIMILFVFLFTIFFYDLIENYKKEDEEPETIAVMQEVIRPISINEEIKESEPLLIEPIEEQQYEQRNLNISYDKFYHSQLDDYSKLIYQALQNNKDLLKNGNEVINLSSKIGEGLENGANIEAIFSVAVNAFENDNPDVFYLDSSKLVLYYEKSSLGKYKFYLKNDEEYSNYLVDGFRSRADVDNAQSQINNVTASIISNANTKNSDYEKIKYIHDWLAENTKYDESLNNANKDSIYGTFIEKEAVCGGYSKAFKYLLDKLNIKCIIVQGIGTTETAQENHAWNYVSLNDKWYGIDCTWDDPIIVGDLRNYTEQKYYTYFLKGQNVFIEGHQPFNTFYGTNLAISYPKLSTEDYN